MDVLLACSMASLLFCFESLSQSFFPYFPILLCISNGFEQPNQRKKQQQHFGKETKKQNLNLKTKTYLEKKGRVKCITVPSRHRVVIV